MAPIVPESSLEDLPHGVRRLFKRLRERLKDALQDNLVGIYFLGSIAFPGFVPDRVDLDFQVVVGHELDEEEIEALRDMHRLLVGEYRYAEHLDGFYVPLSKVREAIPPEELVGAGGEEVWTSVKDGAWALHREHIHQGAVLVLAGPDPRTLFLPATWPEIARALDDERRFIKAHLHHYPFYCVLNLCRLVYTWATKDVAVSKVAAADWAMDTLPARWEPLVRSALRAYRMEDEEVDLERLREGVNSFYQFAARRIDAASGEEGEARV
ncbi:MAG: aminoglycoside adenylyltransferase domain-containing protein [Thermoplasmata archaeon]